MSDRQTRTPTSVLLPTVSWTAACDDVAARLGPGDELLVIHDGESDPVADRKPLPENVQLIPAGDPVGCSGKANAIAAGMEAASHDRLVWTDDDFHHPPDWLDRLREDYAEHGPTTELPAFVGQDPLAVLLEPVYALGGTLGTYMGDHAWGRVVIFDRSDLDEVNQSGHVKPQLHRQVSIPPLQKEQAHQLCVHLTRITNKDPLFHTRVRADAVSQRGTGGVTDRSGVSAPVTLPFYLISYDHTRFVCLEQVARIHQRAEPSGLSSR